MKFLKEKGGLLAHLADQVLEGNFGNGPIALQILKLIDFFRNTVEKFAGGSVVG